MRPIIVLAIIILLYFALKWLIGVFKGSTDDTRNTYILIFSFFLVIALNYGVSFYGYKVPGSFLERSEYERMLYVHVYPSGQYTESYKVPALISRYEKLSCYGEDNCETYRGYLISYAVMPNGGTINFRFRDNNPLKLNKIVYTIDNNNRDWGIQLTNEPVK